MNYRPSFQLSPRTSFDGDYGAFRNITSLVQGGVRVSQRSNRNKWVHGLLSVGSVNLGLLNNDHYFDESSSGESLFALAGADGAKLVVQMPVKQGFKPAAPVWRGLIESKDARVDITTNIAHWNARSPDAVLHENGVGPGAVFAGQSPEDMIFACFNVANVNQFLRQPEVYLHDPTLGGVSVRDVAELLDDENSVKGILNTLLQMFDAQMSYDPFGDRTFIFTRGEMPQSVVPQTKISRVLDILEIEEGTSQVFNYIEMETGLNGVDAMVIAQSEGSIALWGQRALKINAKWIKDLEQIGFLSRWLLGRLSVPQERVKIKVDAWAVPLDRAFVGAPICLQVRADAPANSLRWDAGAFWGDDNLRWAETTSPPLEGEYYIEEIERQLDAETMTLVLRQRPTLKGASNGN